MASKEKASDNKEPVELSEREFKQQIEAARDAMMKRMGSMAQLLDSFEDLEHEIEHEKALGRRVIYIKKPDGSLSVRFEPKQPMGATFKPSTRGN